MGGDRAPRAPIAGALRALTELGDDDIIQLVGRPDVIEDTIRDLLATELAGGEFSRERVVIVPASETIDMAEKPSAVLRGKPDSSMRVGLRLQADGESDAFLSAGNTGAQMALSTLVLRLHEGLKRPAIAAIFPSARRPLVVLDAGANVDCAPAELVQFARLGSVYAEDLLGRDRPAVGLLSIGEEPEKGNQAVKEAHQLLLTAGLNFVGNVEGRDLPRGEAAGHELDVVVCDGFTGNVLLKFYEGIAPFLIQLVSDRVGQDPRDLSAQLKQLDYAEYGGAPLLGVRGVSIIAHGRSDARAMKNAILVAKRAVTSHMNTHIGRRLITAGSEA
jgi:glycerol-3-phosphate acyltransferase PlsX